MRASSSEAFRNSLPSRAGRWLLALLIPASALAVGTVHRISLLIVSAAIAIALGLVWAAPIGKLPRDVRWIVYGALVLIGFTALQVIPLPNGLVGAIAPVNADIWARSLVPFGEDGLAFHPISVAPTMTYLQILRGLVYLAVYLATVRLVASDQAVFVERAIVLSTSLMGMLALAHPAVGAEKVLGLYRPRNLYAFSTNYYAPLLNPNHLAAYLNIGFCLAFASLLGAKPMLPRPLLGALALFLAGSSIWAGSRGGMGALALAIITIGFLSTWAKSKRSYRGGQFVVAPLIGMAAAILIGFASSDSARGELSNTDLGKLDVAKRALDLIFEAPWFGFGRGAFEDVFPRVSTELRYVTYTNPENIVAQWTTEWGLPVSLFAGAVFLWALRPANVLSSIRPAIGAWTAIIVSVVHDLVDFHLEVPGVMIPIAACAAIVTSRRVPGTESRVLGNKVFALSAVTGVVALLVAFSSGSSLADDRERLSKHAVDSTVGAETFRAEERSAMLRHPSEPFLPLMGAVRAQVFGEGSVVSWVAAALERYPRFGRAHLVLARSLGRRNPSQARLEYRLAYEYDLGLRGEVITEGAKLVDGVSTAFELVVAGTGRERALELLSSELTQRLPATSYALDTELLRAEPSNDVVLMRRAEDAVSDLTNHHPWCATEDCAGAALDATEANVRAHPERCAPHLLRARAVTVSSEDIVVRQRALDELVKSLDEVAERTRCQRSILELLRELGDDRYIGTMLQAIMRGGCGSDAECVDLYVWAAQFEERRSREVSALAYYKQALQRDHEREDVLAAILRIASKHDLLVDAHMAADALARRHPDDAQRAATAASIEERLRVQRLSDSARHPTLR